MKKSIITVLSIVTILATLVCMACTTSANASSLTTVSPWAKEIVQEANLTGILPPDLYLIDYTAPMTRHQIASLAASAYDRITGTYGNPKSSGFADIDNYAEKRVKELGIMNGKGNNLFKPNDYLTREEMAKIIITFRGIIDGTGLPGGGWASLTDFEEVSEWAQPFVAEAFETGIIKGRNDGAFHPRDNVTVEEAIAVFVRLKASQQSTKPTMTCEDTVNGKIYLGRTPVTVVVENSPTGFTLYDYCISDTSAYIKEIGKATCTPDGKGEINISIAQFDSEASHRLVVCSADGVYSEPVNLMCFSEKLNLNGEITRLDEYTQVLNLTWNEIPSAEIYTITITEYRHSVGLGEILPSDPVTYDVIGETSFSLEIAAGMNFVIDLEAAGRYCSGTISSDINYDYDLASRLVATTPASADEAKALMTKVTVPVWKIKNGEKYASELSFEVHHLLADKVVAVFTEIFNGPEKFPIYSAGGYSWRGGRSEHNNGTAIDINANENYCIYSSGSVVGSYWKPYEDVYSVTPYGDVVKTFEKYGFTWGGDAWFNGESGTRDYMHFSYLGT